jgi:hypothetical protein
VIDSEGLKNKSCILAALTDRYMYCKKSSALARKYDKAYVPWDGVYMIWCNLDIANVNFEDFLKKRKAMSRAGLRIRALMRTARAWIRGIKRLRNGDCWGVSEYLAVAMVHAIYPLCMQYVSRLLQFPSPYSK